MNYLEGITSDHILGGLDPKSVIVEALEEFLELKRSRSTPSAEKPVHFWIFFETLVDNALDGRGTALSKDNP